MKTIIVSIENNNKSIMNIIRTEYPTLPLSEIYKAFDRNDIKCNKKKIKQNHKVKTNDIISIYIKDEYFNISKEKIEIIYEDNNILVAFKPNRMLTLSQNNTRSLTNILMEKYPNIKPCHRIDFNTKGLVLFAKNEKVLADMKEAFTNHYIEKYYHACIKGKLKTKAATLTAYLFKDSKKNIVYISDNQKKGYRKIITEYVVLKEYNNNSIVLVKLITGRTHQIRAHFAHLSHPLVGDGKYGSIDNIDKKKAQMLLASKLSFKFPNNHYLSYLNDKEISLKNPEKHLK